MTQSSLFDSGTNPCSRSFEIASGSASATNVSSQPSFPSREQETDLPSLSMELPHRTGSRIFALVVGINQYQSSRKSQLKGAVNDAHQMVQLLQTSFAVPSCHISLLCDLDATRQSIISAFQDLAQNGDIRRGDAIIIYFAGHGSRAPAPRDWPAAEDGMVETICPVDEDFNSDIHGIPDRTIAGLVYNISEAKGNNITLIFDCCHSGGIARGDVQEPLHRSAPPSPHFPANLDKAIWINLPQPRGGVQPGGFSELLARYVLLAACRPHELAFETISEDEPRGAFSSVLFRHLQISGHETTYSKLLRRVARELTIYSQNPICEGANKTRLVFDDVAARHDTKLFTLSISKEGLYSVEAGAVHGISPGSRFSVHALDKEGGVYTEIGVLRAQKVFVASSVLQAVNGDKPFKVTPHCSVGVQCWGSSSDILHVFPAGVLDTWVEATSYHYPRYYTTSSPSESTLALRLVDGNQVAFKRGSPIAKYTTEPLLLPIMFTPRVLRDTLNRIGDFHFNLVRRNPQAPYALEGKVRLGLHKLEEGSGTAGEDLVSDNQVEVTTETVYGFTIVNSSNLDLFPYLFFFDGTDYSIKSWYHPTTENMPAPLRGSHGPSSLPVGFRGSPFGPFEFTVPNNAESDIGFFKLFVSTCPVDMSSVLQDSPFLSAGMASAARARGGREVEGQKSAQPIDNTWDAYCYTVIIHKM